MKLVPAVSTWTFKHLTDQYASPLRSLERIQSPAFGAELWLNWQARRGLGARNREHLRGTELNIALAAPIVTIR